MTSDKQTLLLRRSIQQINQLRRELSAAKAASRGPIAIVGMACRTPGGVTSPEAYWSLLAAGRDAIGPFPERWDVEALYDPDPEAVGRSVSREGGFLDDIAGFDAGFFGIAPREALAMDPQQRLTLEVSWEAFESAGVDPATLVGSATGVYLGSLGSDYGVFGSMDELDGYVATGRASSVLAGRLAYTLGLEGPTMTVDTACSSSLVALHLAVAGLRLGECDLAVAGGVQTMTTPATFVEFSRLRGLAPDGRCKSFSARANGASWAEGIGILVLKRLADARRDGDRVLAVVRGTAVNQDGRSQGLTAPNGPSQQRVIRRALSVAGLKPGDIDAVEAHGTGTTLGDPIEAGALGEIFGSSRGEGRPLWLGSSKSNIGHAQAAAGVLGVMKMVLALHHGSLPRTLHAETPSPHIDWTGSGLSLLQSARPWPRRPDHVRRAGISSFGISGTNAHVVLEEAPAVDPLAVEAVGPTLPLLVSGRNAAALRDQARRWGAWLAAHPDAEPSAVLRAAVARSHLDARAAVMAPYAEGLAALADDRAHPGVVVDQRRVAGGPVFVCPGHGSQWHGMGRALLDDSDAFADAVGACDAALAPHTGWSVRAVLAGEPDAPDLDRIDVVQPALFAMSVGLAAMWRALGVEPAAVVGHSVGEVAAAVIAGALTLADGARVVARRGRLIADVDAAGGMLAVAMSADALAARLSGTELVVAVVNGTEAAVASGELAAIAALETTLKTEGVRCRRVDIGFAAHGRHMDGILDAFADAIDGITPQAGTVAMYSSVMGGRIDGMSLGPGYWRRNIRDVVRFDRVLDALRGDGFGTFVELGGHPVLAGPLSDGGGAETVVVGALRRGGDLGTTHRALGVLHAAGQVVDWPRLMGPGPMAPLPTYAFQRTRYWLETRPPVDVRAAGLMPAGHALLGARIDVAGDDRLLLTGRLGRRAPAWLADHGVFDTVLVPGTALLELALLAARETRCGGVAALSLSTPLALPERGAVTVLLEVDPPDERGDRSLTLHGRPADSAPDAPWTLHAEGRLTAAGPTVPEAPPEWAAWPPAGTDRVDVDGLYPRLAAAGLQYGPAFQALDAVRVGGGRVFARVELPGDARVEDLLLHPALLDAALHALLATAGHDTVHLPFAWSDVALWAAGARSLLVCFEPVEGAGGAVRIEAVDGAGMPVLRGTMHSRPATAAQIRSALRAVTRDLFAVQWTAVVPPEPIDVGAVWTLGGRKGAVGRRFDDWAPLRDALDGAAPPRLVIDVSAEITGAMPTAAVAATTRALEWLKAILAEPRLADSTLVVLTRGAVSTGPSDPVRDLACAPLWGLIRAARNEHPERVVRLVDGDGGELGGALNHDDEPELALRHGRALAPRLVSSEPGLPAPATGDWRLHLPEGGSLDGLTVVDADAVDGPLEPGMVRVAVRAAGINFRDALNALGMVPAPWLGLELAGEILEVAPGVDRFAVGDRVMGLGRASFATVAVADARTLTRVPPTLSFVDAATVPLVFATALYALIDLADLKAGERLLVHAAAGGVGMAAVQLAGILGAEVYGTASPGKWPTLLEMGLAPDHIANSRTLAFADAFAAQTAGAGVDVVLNALAREFVDASLRLLPRGGRFLEMGKTDVREPEAIAAAHPGVVYRAFDLVEAGPDRTGAILDRIGAWLAAGRLTPLPATAFDLRQAPAAFRHLANGHNIGKLVLTPPRRLSGAGTALITGGSGALGRALATHLVERHGIRHLVLASRRGVASDWIHDLGAESVVVARCDVGDGAQVAAMLADIPATRPLRAVFHLAGLLDDGLVVGQTPERLAAVLRPKVHGAWHLHQQTLHLDLDAFVLFSSVAGVMGSPGQSTYAAANAFLDALASQRRATGRAAHSLAWGLWTSEGGGMAAHLTSADRARMKRQGFEALSFDRGLALFDAAVARPDVVAVPIRLELARMQRDLGAGTPPALLRRVLRPVLRQIEVSAPKARALRARLARLGEAERAAVVLDLVRGEVASVLGMADAGDTPADRPLSDLGLDSLMAVELRNRLAARTEVALPATLAFDYPTPQAIAGLLMGLAFAESMPAAADVAPVAAAADAAIAIVGMACRTPGGAEDPAGYWSLLAEGRDAVGPFPERWDTDALYDPDPDSPGRSIARQGGFLDDIAGFDAGFFGIAPREAAAMDPQQRLALEVSWEALEDSGIAADGLMGSATGVYLGSLGSDYAMGGGLEELDGYRGTGRASSVIAGRVAYALGLEGPAMTIDTACSSSLVAVHLAANALRRGECDLAVAGGVQVMTTPAIFVEFSRLRGLARDGRCKSFSAEADGTGWAEGVGVVVLKRLSDARRDGDRVLAVVRGSAVNQDGRSQGLTAPNGPSQQRVIRRALAVAGLEPSDIDAVEAHGTGTRLGDPIEAGALAAVFGSSRVAERPLWLGSAKSNIGHAQAAAGVLGLMKMVLALRHETLPPTLHAAAPSPHIEWADSGLALLTTARPWPRRDGHRRRAGISSFGVSGTNAHIVIEEADDPAKAPAEPLESTLPLVLSGQSAEALWAQADRWSAWLAAHPDADLNAVRRAAAVGRSHLPERAAVQAPFGEALAALAVDRPHRRLRTGTARPRRGVVFVCPGHGSQWHGMGRALLDESDAFADAVDACDAALMPHTGWSVRAVLAAAPGAPDLDRVDVVQPALFAMSVGLAAVWRAFGVEPAAVVGHSVGEIAAAVIAGALSMDDGARIVAVRGRLIAGVEEAGAMLSVALPPDVLAARLAGSGLVVAVVNSGTASVASGDREAIEFLRRTLDDDGIRCRRVAIGFAAHSPHMDAIVDAFVDAIGGVGGQPSAVPLYSAVTGAVIEGTTLDSAYWRRNVRDAVRFDQVARGLVADGRDVFIELGGHPVLRAALGDAAGTHGAVIGSLRRDEGVGRVHAALGALHVAGHDIDWRRVMGDGPMATLPTYAFQRQRFWLDGRAGFGEPRALGLEPSAHALLGARIAVAGDDALLLTGRVSRRQHPWLADHRVLGAVLMPGTGLLELALWAAREAGAAGVQALTLAAPMVLPRTGDVAVQVKIGAPDGQGDRDVSVHGRPADVGGDAPWTLHATGRLAGGPLPAADGAQPEAPWPPSGTDGVSIDGLYAEVATRGYEYGPAFQGLREVRTGDGCVFARVELPSDVEDGDLLLHPALLDAALHALLAVETSTDDGLHLPFAWSDAALFAFGPRSLVVRLEPRDVGGQRSVCLEAVDGDGLPVLSATLATRPATAAGLRRAVAPATRDLFAVGWVEVPGADGPKPDEVWSVGGAGRLGGRHFARWDELDIALSHLDASVAPPRIVIDAHDGLDGQNDVPSRAQAALDWTLAILQSALAEPRLERAAIIVTTRRAASTGPDASPDNLAWAGVWGLVRAARSEWPGRVVRLVDRGHADLPTAALMRDDEPELAVRGDRLLAPRLDRLAPPTAPAEPLGEGTALITGGLGALGRTLAEHLVDRHGVRHLLLVSRRSEAPEWVDALGAESVTVDQCDVGDAEQVEALIARIDPARPLRSVFHLAGVLDDGLLTAQTPERLSTVLRPKVHGAWNLHHQTLELDLDAFVLFSSAAGVMGSPGQSTYAAANAFLDALALHRRGTGRPAQSLAWGLWAPQGGGMAAHLSLADLARLKRQGVEPLSAAQGLALLDAALASAHPTPIPMRLDLRQIERSLDGGPVPAMLRGLVRPTLRPVAGGPRADALRQRLAALSAPERVAEVQRLVCGEAAVALGLADAHAVPVDQPLSELGLDSLMAVDLRNRLVARTEVELPTTLVFDHPTPGAIAALLMGLAFGELPGAVRPARRPVGASDEPIAIVGMACRTPGGAASPDAFWSLLSDGRDAIGPFPSRWDADALYDPDPDAAGHSVSREGGFLDDVAGFDAGFFGIARREAEAMDPQQRLALETVWEALEDGGLPPGSLMGSSTGVYLGSMGSDYGTIGGLDELDGYRGTGQASSVLSGRVAYALGLEGPTMTLDTACSSSLVALHLAATALRQGECELAVAGGVHVMATPVTFVEFSRLRGLAPDGRCKSFSAGADGVGWSEGAGMVVLKRLSDARRDGDRVVAVVRGTAVNQDGRSQGLTAPNGPSQQRVIQRALAMADLAPGDIDAVEAHGTGTPLGDPIEAGALRGVFGPGRPADRPLWLGSVKSNIGHSQGAAGVLGVIKMALALRHETLPRTLHAETPSPHIEWTGSGLSLLHAARPWRAQPGHVRRAGISSFGISGTNAHAIIEEAPDARRPAATPLSASVPLVVSAKSAAALQAQAGRWATWLAAHPGVDEDAMRRTAALGRSHMAERAAVMAPLAEGLAALGRGASAPGVIVGTARPRGGLVFVCPGHGSQWYGMGRKLLSESNVFADAIDACDAALIPYLGWSVRAVLAGDDGAPDLDRIEVVQPALFAMSVGLAAVWRALGVVPAAIVGHSVGEVAAAVVAEVLSLDDGARVVAERGRLIAQVGREGGMLAVALSADDLAARLGGTGLSVAVVNGPSASVASGDVDAIEVLRSTLAAEGVPCRRVAIAFAAHSDHMDAILDAFVDAIDGIVPRPGAVPIYSAVTGTRVDGAELDVAYWRRNVREVVRFDRVVDALTGDGRDVFVELGGHPALVAPLSDAVGLDGLVVGSLRRDEGSEAVHRALGALHVAGCRVDWAQVLGSGPLVDLPTYAFQRERYWLDAPTMSGRPADVMAANLLDVLAGSDVAEAAEMLALPDEARGALEVVLPHLVEWRTRASEDATRAQWLYRARWQPADDARSGSQATPGPMWVVGADAVTVDAARAWWPGGAGAVEFLTSGEALGRLAPPSPPDRPVNAPANVVWLPPLVAGVDAAADALAELVVLTRGIMAAPGAARLSVVTRGAQPVLGAVDDLPWSAEMVWGLGRALAMTAPARWGVLVDVPPGPLTDDDGARLVEALLETDGEDQIAVRGGRRFVRRVVRCADVGLRAATGAARWRPGGTVVITGGLGAIGLALARWLVVERGARYLVLVSRRGPDAPEAAGLGDALRALGAQAVRVMAADVSAPAQVEALVGAVDAAGLPPITSVFHCAGVSDMRPLADVDAASFERALAGKVGGALALDAALAGASLDAFVLFGSIAGLWGAGQQVGYAAANAALTGLARQRRAAGLRASVVHWGAWGDGGMVDAEARAWLARRGIRTMAPAAALATLGWSLDAGTTPTSATARALDDVAVVDLDWARFVGSVGTFRPVPLFAGVPEARAHLDAIAPEVDAGAEALDLARLPAPERRTQLTALVAEVVAVVLGLPESTAVQMDVGFFEQGVDSLMGVELRRRLHARTGLQLGATFWLDHPSPKAVVEHVVAELDRGVIATPVEPAVAEAPVAVVAPPGEGADRGVLSLRGAAPRPTTWLVPIQPATTPRLRVLCFPYAGGGAAVFGRWRGRLPADVEVLAVELPGRGLRSAEPAARSFDAIVAGVCAEVAALSDCPLMVFGHCVGAVIGFEVARALTALGVPCRHFFASGAAAPHLYLVAQDPDAADDVLMRDLELIGLSGLDAMKRDADFKAFALGVMRADLRLACSYGYDADPTGLFPVTIFSGTADIFAATAAVDAWRRYAPEPDAVRHYQYSGGHYFLEVEFDPMMQIVEEVLAAEKALIAARPGLPRTVPAGEGPVVVYLLGAGSTVADFEHVAAAAGHPDVPAVILESPGQGRRATEPPLRRLPPLAALLEAELAAIHRPVILFGHDIYAHVAMHICRLREARGLPVHRLVVSCSLAPTRYSMPPLHLLQQQVEASQRGLAERLGDPQAARAFEADLSIAFHHVADRRYDGYVEAPITAVKAADDAYVPASGIPAWSRVTTAGCDVQVVTGGHGWFWRRPEALAEIVAEVASG